MKILRWLNNNIEKVFILISTTAILIVLFLEVVLRFSSAIPGFNPNYAWAEEIAIFGLLWLSYWGASYATKTGSDLKVEIITTFLPKKGQLIMNFIANSFMLIFGIFVIVYGGKYVLQVFNAGQTSAVLGWHKWWIYGIAILSFVVQAIRIIQDYGRLKKELKELDNKDVNPQIVEG